MPSSSSVGAYLALLEDVSNITLEDYQYVGGTSGEAGGRRSRRHSGGVSSSTTSPFDTDDVNEVLRRSLDDFQATLNLFEQSQRSRPPIDAVAFLQQRHQEQLQRAAAANYDKKLPPRTADGVLTQLPRARVLPDHRKAFEHDTSICSVCSDRLIDGVALIRLPCGHLYHINCCVPWLNRSNTCPECRYELPTSDLKYEQGRLERMKDRKTIECTCHPSGMHTCFFRDPSKSLFEQCLDDGPGPETRDEELSMTSEGSNVVDPAWSPQMFL